ncbi:phosphoglycerate kinase [Peptoniphilus lacydonensis]|uniref:phosphoglycerate kinase n=1 Tax=Peptoniphilus lacydonensis TaxID=1673725 RepID=UPI002905167F|nr:phosphoglycerate kinase [Peptoniphilus lacydonensis]MBS6611169.1 phosphoglycerate kinase [Peptoniphilus harei]MDU1955188.1 phosphoglycerate kinase [Peptoniphilus lacydonensis]MDU5377779.1 phosphoglycerate kinase [Peptoniphilus lacydonensis]MDU5437034.1 phosphoglycerate kinase [Peptoniphilus lacydonensis]
MKKTIRDFDFNDKVAVVRVDFNVPLKDGKVTGDDRIIKAIPTIDYLLENGAKVILMSHLGRPKGEYKEELSLEPVAKRASELLKRDVKFISSREVVDEEVVKEVSNLKKGDIALLENLRFVKGEEKNDAEFAKKLASLGDIFVNDAFGTAHRAHASNVGITEFLPSCVGLLVEKEIKYFEDKLKNPEKPFAAILGGSKVSDKIGVIENLLKKVDKLVIVGAMANTFLKSKGLEVGKSLVEDDKLDLAREIMAKAIENHVDLILPIDVIVAPEVSEDAKGTHKYVEDVDEDDMILDLGSESLKNIESALKGANTVVLNGPCGVFEIEEFSSGTIELAKILAELDATVIVGGGDSVSAVEKAEVADKLTHISTGGGASLEMLEGKKLPGIEAVEEA